MKILAIAAARGGSKGVKNKNIRLLANEPLIAYTINQIKKWGKFEKFIVSTDSAAIADIARGLGVDVPFMRPPELATDTSGKIEALRHAFKSAEEYYNTKFDALIDLDATAPIRTLQDLDNCLDIFIKDKPDTIYSVVRAHKNPYFNMVEKNSDGHYVLSKSLGSNIKRRQDAPEVYSLNASIYLYKREFILNDKNDTCLTANSRIYIMDDIAGIDIDREVDFKFIEFLIKEGLVQL